MFLQCARVSILRAEKENGYSDVASILGPAFVWERSANVPAPSLTKAWHGCCESLSSTNVQHLRATAPFSSHFTEVCKVDSHVSRRFPPIRLKNRRTFALFTIHVSSTSIFFSMGILTLAGTASTTTSFPSSSSSTDSPISIVVFTPNKRSCIQESL